MDDATSREDDTRADDPLSDEPKSDNSGIAGHAPDVESSSLLSTVVDGDAQLPIPERWPSRRCR